MSKASTTLPQEQLLSSRSTRRQFHSWSRKVRDEQVQGDQYHHHDPHLQQSNNNSYLNKDNISKTTPTTDEEENHEDHDSMEKQHNNNTSGAAGVPTRKKLPAIAAHVSRIRSLISALNAYKLSPHFPRRPGSSAAATGGGGRLGPKVIGTLFGCRRGNVNFVFQKENNTCPVFFVELATPITGLVKEMASGLVRIALECDKHTTTDHQEDNNQAPAAAAGGGASAKRAWRRRRRRRSALLEEPIWRTYCNGKKCGFATKRELGPNELKILKTIEPISMGAGVLPGFNGSGMSGPDGELMYMRAKFERVVGSTDSEAFYMMNPDTNGAPELSIYLLRV